MEKSDSTWQVSIISAWIGDSTLSAMNEKETNGHWHADALESKSKFSLYNKKKMI